MHIIPKDLLFKEKLKAFVCNGPATAMSSMTQMIGPAVIRSDEEGKIKLYGLDAIGTNTLISYTEIMADVISDEEYIFIPDIRPFIETISSLDFKCEISIGENDYEVSNEKYSITQEFDYGEITDTLKRLMEELKVPEGFGKVKFEEIFTVPGKDLAKLQAINKKTAKSEYYTFSKGSISVDNAAQLFVEEGADFDPITVYGVDPIFNSVKNLGSVVVYLDKNRHFLEFHTVYVTYILFIGGGDE